MERRAIGQPSNRLLESCSSILTKPFLRSGNSACTTFVTQAQQFQANGSIRSAVRLELPR